MQKILAEDLAPAHNWKTNCLELIVAELENLKRQNYWIVVMAEAHGLHGAENGINFLSPLFRPII